METEKTIGENRIRVEFNPNKDEIVSFLKQEFAELINKLEDQRNAVPMRETNPEKQRLISIAQTAIEEAAMWAVKSVTC